MGRKLISNSSKHYYKKNVGKFIQDLSQAVAVYTNYYKHQCYNCHYDSVNEKSAGKCKWTPVEAAQKQAEWELAGNIDLRYKYFGSGRCPVCLGVGYIQTIRKRVIKALVHWGMDETTKENFIIKTPAGLEGATSVLIKTDPLYIDLFTNADKLKINNIDFKVSQPPYIRGVGNDSILVVGAYTIESIVINNKPTTKKGYYDQ